MKQKYGIIIIDTIEIVIRIYEADDTEWKLLHYYDNQFNAAKRDREPEVTNIAEIIADFLTTEPAQHVVEWKTCAKKLAPLFVTKLAAITSLPIENLTPLREQELLSKGIFTELW